MKMFRPKTLKMSRPKTLIAALAVAGLATACDRDTVERDAYVPPEPAAVERSTTAAGTTNPSAITSVDNRGNALSGDLTESGALAEADHQETIEFNGSELTAASESKLGELVEALDANKPVKVVVAMDDDIYENTQGEQTATSAQQPNISQENRERYTNAFSERVESVKDYMEEQGVEVTQWQFERLEEQDLDQQNESLESEEEVQSIRLVISANPQDGRFSSVTDE